MNCDAVHHLILTLESPSRPTAAAQSHLTGCPTCRAWLEQLLALERDIPSAPIPPPERRTAFLKQLREMPAPARPSPLRPAPEGKRERGLRKMAVAVALAASLLIVAFGAWLWNREGPPGNQPSADSSKETPLGNRLNADPRWSQANTPRERFTILDEMAGDLESKALALARIQGTPRRQLQEQVRLYSELIDRLTMKEALEVGGELKEKDDRRKYFSPLAQRLAQVESEAKRLALTVPDLADPLNELAVVAADGDRRLRALYL